eukprot:6194122-Pleurochrysis_carterae.AAC.5
MYTRVPGVRSTGAGHRLLGGAIPISQRNRGAGVSTSAATMCKSIAAAGQEQAGVGVQASA